MEGEEGEEGCVGERELKGMRGGGWGREEEKEEMVLREDGEVL